MTAVEPAGRDAWPARAPETSGPVSGAAPGAFLPGAASAPAHISAVPVSARETATRKVVRPDVSTRGGRWSVAAWDALLTVGITVLGLFFLPLRWGTVPFPVSALVVAAALVVLPRAGHRLTGSIVVASVPAVVWFVVTVVLTVYRNALWPALPVVILDWRVLLFLGLGALATALTLGALANAPRRPPTRTVHPPECDAG